MEIDTAGCRAYDRNFIVGKVIPNDVAGRKAVSCKVLGMEHIETCQYSIRIKAWLAGFIDCLILLFRRGEGAFLLAKNLSAGAELVSSSDFAVGINLV